MISPQIATEFCFILAVQMHQEGHQTQDLHPQRIEGRPSPDPERRTRTCCLCRWRHTSWGHVPLARRVRGEKPGKSPFQSTVQWGSKCTQPLIFKLCVPTIKFLILNKFYTWTSHNVLVFCLTLHKFSHINLFRDSLLNPCYDQLASLLWKTLHWGLSSIGIVNLCPIIKYNEDLNTRHSNYWILLQDLNVSLHWNRWHFLSIIQMVCWITYNLAIRQF